MNGVDWRALASIPVGVIGHGIVNTETGEQAAVLDLAWPNGLRQELTEPVAQIIGGDPGLITLAKANGYRCFADAAAFIAYVVKKILGEPVAA